MPCSDSYCCLIRYDPEWKRWFARCKHSMFKSFMYSNTQRKELLRYVDRIYAGCTKIEGPEEEI